MYQLRQAFTSLLTYSVAYQSKPKLSSLQCTQGFLFVQGAVLLHRTQSGMQCSGCGMPASPSLSAWGHMQLVVGTTFQVCAVFRAGSFIGLILNLSVDLSLHRRRSSCSVSMHDIASMCDTRMSSSVTTQKEATDTFFFTTERSLLA